MRVSADPCSFDERPTLQTGPKHTRKLKFRGSYRRYTIDQIERLFDLVIEEGTTAKEHFYIFTLVHYY